MLIILASDFAVEPAMLRQSGCSAEVMLGNIGSNVRQENFKQRVDTVFAQKYFQCFLLLIRLRILLTTVNVSV